MVKFKQVVLVVLDGFGVASAWEGNAVTAANPETINYLVNHYPALTLQASGPVVGLPWAERGNSETGHLNMGAGRVVAQDLLRINQAVTSGDFFKNPAFVGAFEHVKKNSSKLHLIGLISPGGIHSSEEHFHALLSMAKEAGVSQVFVHMITDGRDSDPKVALKTLDRFNRQFFHLGIGKIATVSGRFYAMDRGGHWDLTKKTYQAMALGLGEETDSAYNAVRQAYDKQLSDETIPPTVIMEGDQPVSRMTSGDAVIFFNFRPDRMLQLARSLIDPSFDKFAENYSKLEDLYAVTMTSYSESLTAHAAFPASPMINGLGEVLSRNNFSQCRIAETEKYAHVTSFFNGGRETPFPGEIRKIIASPLSYEERYENVPAMSAAGVTQAAIAQISSGTNFVLINFANPDMVGHTGNIDACIAAVRAVDVSLRAILEAVKKTGACLIVTADHGKIEQILDPATGIIDKDHSPNPVPFLIAAKEFGLLSLREKGYVELPAMVPEGVLSDVAPTVLELFGIEKPKEMHAESLLPIILKQTKEIGPK